MNLKKKREFNSKMSLKSRFPRHINMMAKGGVVRQQYADGGATVVPTNPTASGVSGPSGGGTVNNANGPQGVGGFISHAIGTNNNFQAGAANIQAGTNTDQINSAYTGANNAINSQVGLTNQLAPQVGNAVNNQNAVANQELGIVNGTGPNPALAQLNQTTAQNVNNQAALMAGQRGAGSNVGLIARQAAQQGAATQQQAVGQGATLAAQQQIAAAQNLATLSNAQVSQAGQATTNLNSEQQAEQAILQNANTAYNNAGVSMQSNINNANQATSAQNAGTNNGIIGGILGGVSALAGFAEGGEVSENPNLGQFKEGQPVSTGNLTAPDINLVSNSKNIQDAYDSGKKSISPKDSDDFDYPELEQPDIGSSFGSQISNLSPAPTLGSNISLTGAAPASSAAPFALEAAPLVFANGGMAHDHFHQYFSGGGPVKALVSPKEVYLEPEQVHKVLKEGADPMKIGHRFPGKDKVKGRNSFKNDVIPTTLRDGGMVIPVSVTTHRNASHKSRQFVMKHMKRPKGA